MGSEETVSARLTVTVLNELIDPGSMLNHDHREERASGGGEAAGGSRVRLKIQLGLAPARRGLPWGLRLCAPHCPRFRHGLIRRHPFSSALQAPVRVCRIGG